MSTIIGKRIRLLRNENRMTQADLGTKLGVGKTTISNYETGNSYPDNEIVLKLSKLFNVSTDFILGKTVKRDHGELTKRDDDDVAKMIDEMKMRFESDNDATLNYDGIQLTEEDKEFFYDLFEFAAKRIKKKNKEKYTPNKYKNNLSDSDKN